ncbi:hypothetical protein C8Q72DRAFT_880871 [Fomitopsis betulina]|nr:hypothetical protein C8Q72DRAFT_880871 [Fomitopsis betulina]
MDTAIPVMLTQELASDMVNLLGEELKRLRAKLRALEQELRVAREAQPRQEEKPDVWTTDALNAQIAGLRKRLCSLEEELRQKSEMLQALEDRVSQKDVMLLVYAEEAKKKQDMITSFTRLCTRNEKKVRNERAVASLHVEAQRVETDDKIQALEDFKKMAQLSLQSLSDERDRARAAKSELEEKCNSSFFKMSQRDQYKADMRKNQEETKSYEAQYKEAKNTVANPAWAVQFGRFLSMMQALSEPTEPLPCRTKLRPCLSADCVGNTPRVFKIIHRVYKSQTVLYLPSLALWHPTSRHGVAVIPAYNYTTNAVTQCSEWTPNSLRVTVHGQTREVFYREKGKVTYAGTYKLLAGPTLLGVTPANHTHLGRPDNAMKRLARRTLETAAGRDQGVFDVVVAAYTQGVLPFEMLGLQCVGYKAGFEEPLRA